MAKRVQHEWAKTLGASLDEAMNAARIALSEAEACCAEAAGVASCSVRSAWPIRPGTGYRTRHRPRCPAWVRPLPCWTR